GARVLRRTHSAGGKRAETLGRVRAARNGQAGCSEAQGADGTQSRDRRGDQDSGEDCREGANREAAEGYGSPSQVTRSPFSSPRRLWDFGLWLAFGDAESRKPGA